MTRKMEFNLSQHHPSSVTFEITQNPWMEQGRFTRRGQVCVLCFYFYSNIQTGIAVWFSGAVCLVRYCDLMRHVLCLVFVHIFSDHLCSSYLRIRVTVCFESEREVAQNHPIICAGVIWLVLTQDRMLRLVFI